MKIKTTHETEINVDFPVYRKFGSKLFKLISESEYIGVNIKEVNPLESYEIDMRTGYYSSVSTIYTDGVEIPAKQFTDALGIALNDINQHEEKRSVVSVASVEQADDLIKELNKQYP